MGTPHSEPSFCRAVRGWIGLPHAKTSRAPAISGTSAPPLPHPAGVGDPGGVEAREMEELGAGLPCAEPGFHWRRFAAPWWLQEILLLPRVS